MNREEFRDLVEKTLSALPAEFQMRLENIDMVVEDWPTCDHLTKTGPKDQMDLLGLYEGIPLTERSGYYGMVPPDKITIFQKPIEAQCNCDEEIEEQVREVVYHEIAHHFGISDEQLEIIEDEKRQL